MNVSARRELQLGGSTGKAETPPFRPYRPDFRGLCLCGSGLRFRECCKDRLPGFDIGKHWRELADAGRWLLAIKHLRADITQYTIWHRSHTVPGVLRQPELRQGRLMRIDIEALDDYVETLMWAYARNGWLKNLPATLDRLKANIDDPRWLRKIAYQRGICALWREDRAQAAREIEPLQPITPAEEDVNILQIHVDLLGGQMGLSERLAFFDRICAVTEHRSDKLQYGGARAFELLLAGDSDGARAKFDEVIALGCGMEEEKPLSIAAESWFCKSLEGRAVLDQDRALFAEIVTRLGKLVNNSRTLTPAGRAMVLREIGDAHRYAGAYADALTAYRASFEAMPNQAIRTFEAECELRNGQIDEAFRLIRSVSVDKLDSPERTDHAFTFFYIALARRDRRSLIDARDLLKLAETPSPYFNMLRLQHIVTVGEAIEALDAHRELPEIGPVLAALKTVSRYIQMKPSFIGIGINVNTIIDDMVVRAEERANRERDESPTYAQTSGAGPKNGKGE
jgi:tetratricopeptide (TPR) repeat protein